MRTIFLFVFCLSNLIRSNAQITGFEFASAIKREEQEKKLRSIVDKTIMQPFSSATYASWKSACWAMELMLYKPANYENSIPDLLKGFADYDANMQWILLQNIFTLFPKKFANEIEASWVFAKTNKIKAAIAAYLQTADKSINLHKQDPFFESDYYQAFTNYYHPKNSIKFSEHDFLHKSFLPNENILISFQHRNRDKPGYLMIRKADGNWLCDSSGKPYRFTQLARSITNMPFFLTNGNTPQGLYKIIGFDNSTNAWIGPTTNLQIVLPFEKEVNIPFFTDTTNAKEAYAKLLTPFATAPALWESFDAGRLGRSEIIAHGTTIPEKFYVDQFYYPCTPSLGCLCSPEIWDKSGKLVSSVQQQWILLVQQLPATPTWLLVVDL